MKTYSLLNSSPTATHSPSHKRNPRTQTAAHVVTSIKVAGVKTEIIVATTTMKRKVITGGKNNPMMIFDMFFISIGLIRNKGLLVIRAGVLVLPYYIRIYQ